MGEGWKSMGDHHHPARATTRGRPYYTKRKRAYRRIPLVVARVGSLLAVLYLCSLVPENRQRPNQVLDARKRCPDDRENNQNIGE